MRNQQVILLILLFLVTNLAGVITAMQIQGYESVQEVSKSYQSPESGLGFFVMVGISTILMLLLYKYNVNVLLRAWMGLAIFITAMLFFGAYLPLIPAVLGAGLAVLTRFKGTNMMMRNVATAISFAGAGAFFGSILSLPAATVLLLILAAYDLFAVNISKHMITLAKKGVESDTFMGFTYPKASGGIPAEASAQTEAHAAEAVASADGTEQGGIGILGGGDIIIPMLFGITVIEPYGLTAALASIFGAAAALYVLMVKAKQGTFYPAIPVLAIGLFWGLGVALIVQTLI